MKFKVGDKVRIRENLSCDEEYPLVEFISTMEKFKGKEAIIIDVDFFQKMYLINLDNGEHWWVAEMLEPTKTQDQQKIEELEKRMEKLEKEVFKPVVGHDKPKEKSLLTEDERVILRNLDKKWKWIARDENECLCVYDKIPRKGKYKLWLATNDYERMNVLKKGIFQFIKWTDSEPYNIEELLKGECGNE